MPELESCLSVFLIAWFAFFGMCIGSFLNVVVYRLPLKKSLSYPPSFCPKCKHPVRWFDNIPVFGWLFLRGKCRDCREPISIRYPAVEALCGIIFGACAYFLLPAFKDETQFFFYFSEVFLLACIPTILLAVVLMRWDKTPGKQ